MLTSGKTLKDQGSLQSPETTATILGVHVDASEAQLSNFLVYIHRKMFLFVPLSSIRLEFPLGEVICSFLNKFLFLVQELVIHEQTDAALGD
jgi:hypothetical protein